jgi:hypothetical protein
VKLALIFAALALLAGCATSPTGGDGTLLDGKLISLADGVVMPFQIERSRAVGAVKAQNPMTGEKFEGQYSGRFTDAVSGSSVSSSGPSGTHQSTLRLSHGSGAEARGFLKGDKGTLITLDLDIVPGFRPHGTGDGLDNKGQRYQIQF